jgi:alkanesulfonate monooxygenase SsuD/methylene tetrahydromethanopterin reductase-like flavin-dependent oxidoreductase (luciferase family)
MGLPFAVRFDFRNPAFADTSFADRYQTALDMVAWADRLGCLAVTVSEHHGSPDGYLPSPLPMLAAMAAVTTNVRFAVAALIAPFYDPIRLCEDMVVLDHLSRGRVDLIVAAGYVPVEFDMYEVALRDRGARVTEVVQTLKAAFTGEPFSFRGRTVQVTPPPYRPGGPSVVLGGSSEAAARRAARIADGFLPSVPEVWEFYADELRVLRKGDPGPCPVGTTPTVFLARDPESAWEQVAPFFLHEANAYGTWLDEGDGAGPYRRVDGQDDLRQSGLYEVLRPEEYVARLTATAAPLAMLHPLCGGLPPELAWSSLKLFEREVLPAFEP